VLKLVEEPLQRAPKLPHHPDWVRGFALLIIRDGHDIERVLDIFRGPGEREQLAAELDALRAQRVMPQRAAILYRAHLPALNRMWARAGLPPM